MFSGNTLAFHHCFCGKTFSTYVAITNAAGTRTKHDTDLADDCTCNPVTHNSACSIKLSSQHLKQAVWIIHLYCACRKCSENQLAIRTNRKNWKFLSQEMHIDNLIIIIILIRILKFIYLKQTISLSYILLQLWLKITIF